MDSYYILNVDVEYYDESNLYTNEIILMKNKNITYIENLKVNLNKPITCWTINRRLFFIKPKVNEKSLIITISIFIILEIINLIC